MAKKTRRRVTKKGATRRAKRRTSRVSTQELNAQKAAQAAELLASLADVYRVAAAQIPDGGTMPFDMIEIAVQVRPLTVLVKDILAAFDTTALRLEDTDGDFEDRDEYLVTCKTTKGRLSVQWKDEAAQMAEIVARKERRDFNLKDYLESVQALAKRAADTRKVEIHTR